LLLNADTAHIEDDNPYVADFAIGQWINSYLVLAFFGAAIKHSLFIEDDQRMAEICHPKDGKAAKRKGSDLLFI